MTWLLIVVIVIVGLVLFFVPGIDPTLRKLLIGICVVMFILWLLALLFGWPAGPGYIYYHDRVTYPAQHPLP